MGSARILGCAVNVEKQPVDNDAVYTVSGEGASRLHRVCSEFGTSPTDLVGDTFTVTKSALSDYFNLGDTPAVTAIRDALHMATRGEKQPGH